MPPELVEIQPSSPGPPIPSNPRPLVGRRAIFVVLALLLLSGLGYGATVLFTKGSPKPSPSASPAPGVSTTERSKIADTASPITQLNVTTLTATSGDIGTLLVKALQVATTISLGGDLSAAGNATFSGTVKASNFQGSGAGLTNVDATTLGGKAAAFYQQLANLQGTLSDTQLSSNVALRGAANTFTAPNTFNAGLSTTSLSASGPTTLGGTTNLTGTTTISSLFLGSPLGVPEGGTGLATIPAQAVLYGTGTTPLATATPAGAGLCLISGVSDLQWGSCSGGGGGVVSVNGLTGILTLANATGAGSTITINDATTAQKGIASFNGTNFSVAAGAVNTIQNIAPTSSPTFAAVNTNALTPSAALTLGATGQNLTLQGAATTIAAHNGANTTTFSFVSPTANVTYQLQTAAAGTYDICTTAANCAGVGGGVTTPGGTTGTIPKFTGAQTLGNSLITDNGTLVTIGGNLSVTGTVTLAAPLPVAQGGTGGITAAAARTSLSAAVSGANADITSLTGLTTALSVTQGGTGATSLANNGVVIGAGTGALTAVTAGSAGLCLISNAGAPSFQTCPGSGGIVSLNGLTGTLSIAGATGSGSTITINDATTGAKGIASFNATNFTTSSGAVNTIQDIATAASPTFAALNTNTLTPSAALTLGATTQAFTLQGNASSTITTTGGGFTTTVGFTGTPTGAVTYNFDRSPAAGTYSICTTVGNCAGSGGGVTTPGGTTNKLAKFTASSVIANSSITDTGASVSLTPSSDNASVFQVQNAAGRSVLNVDTSTGKLTLGNITASAGQGVAGSIVLADGTNDNFGLTLSAATLTANRSITIPNAGGTIAVSATGPLSLDAAGNLTCATCVTSGGGGGGASAVDSLNLLTGALTIANASTAGSTITINDATTAAKGIASFNSTNFTTSSGAVNTIQNIATTSAPTFGQLTITSSQASNAMITVNNTNGSATGNLIDLQLAGSSKFSVSPSGNATAAGNLNGVTGINTGSGAGTQRIDASGNLTNIGTITSGLINGQTISSAANFTGTLAVTSLATLSGGATVTGTLTANVLTPTSALIIGAVAQKFTLQGDATSVITAKHAASGFTTTVGFSGTPTGAVTYNFDQSAAPSTYSICTTAGNCTSLGGAVTTPGGTTNTIPKFTGAQTLGNSGLSDDGTTVSVAENLSVTGNKNFTIASGTATIQGANALTVGLTGTNTGAVLFKGSTAASGTLTLAGPANPNTGNFTLTIPAINTNATICVDNSASTCSLQTAYNASTGGINATPTIKLNNSVADINIQDANGGLGAGNFLSLRSANSGGLGNVVFGFGIQGQFFEKPSTDTTTAVQIENSTGNTLFAVDSSGGYVNLGSTGGSTGGTGSAFNGSTTNIETSPNANTTTNIGSTAQNSGTATINIGYTNTSGGGSDVNIGSGTNSTGGATVIQGNGVTITAGAASTWSTVAGNLTVQAAGTNTLALDTGGAGTVSVGTTNAGTINIGAQLGFHNSTVSIATDSNNTQTVSIGSDGSAANATTILAGSTGGLNIGSTGSNTESINIGSTIASATSVNIKGGSTGGINIGNVVATQMIRIGSSGSASTTNIQGGSGASAVQLDAQAGGTISIGSTNNNILSLAGTSTTGTVTIGGASQTGQLTLGQSTASNTINVGNAALTNTQTINIATAATGAGVDAVTIGSTNGASATTLQAGTGNINLVTNSASAGTTVKTNTNSASAFLVQNSTSVNYLTVDTANQKVVIGNASTSTPIILVLGSETSTTDPSSGSSVNGAMYYNAGLNQFRCYRESNWGDCAGIAIDSGFNITDEFLGGTGATTNGSIGNANWTAGPIGSAVFTGGSVNSHISYNGGGVLPSTNHPGIIRFQPNDSGTPGTNTGISLALATTSGAGAMALQATWDMKFSVAVGSASTSTQVFRAGAHNEVGAAPTTAQPTTGVWWEADPAASANWEYCYADGSGTAQCSATGAPAIAANTLVSFGIHINSLGTNTSSVTFTANNAVVATVAGGTTTVNTTNLVAPAMVCYAVPASAQNCYADYYQISGTMSAMR